MRNNVQTIDVVLIVAVSTVGVFAVASLLVDLPRAVIAASVIGLVLVALTSVVARAVTRPDHLRALQSQQILDIANPSLTFLRQGLTAETAQAVCRIALAETEAGAVAITDRDTVLGFAGLGEDHHEVGGPIITRATMEAIEHNEHRILGSKEEIGCPKRECLLKAAIVVPLLMRGEPVGTLKFYYTTPRLLNETQITMAEGLAMLLSTQLELSELDRQTELATRMELKALQAQINPHFLFNTINTIASLIRTDPPEARRLLREFASFYRRTLEESDDLVPFKRELEYTCSYFGFERARFGERVQLIEDVEPETLQVTVPAFILQPLVENSVQHGIRAVEPLHIRVSAHLIGSCLTVKVVDDGVGISEADLPRVLEPGFGRGLGIAMKNVEDRLKGHFGRESFLKIESTEGVGTTVTLSIELGSGRAEGDGG